MERWIGIRVSAVLAILGSLATLLFAASMIFAVLRPSAAEPPPSPIPLRLVLLVMAAMFLGFTAWGIASAIGILRRRGWARISMIVFACLLVGMGGSALVMILFVHLPETPNASPQMMQNIRLGIAAVYGSMTVIGAWWLLLFNSSATRQYFATPPEAGGRPLSVSIIGWYLLVSALGTALAAILRAPGMFCGVVFTGGVAIAVYTLYTAIQIYLGSGLLQWQETARVGSIAYFAVMIANSVVSAVAPGFAGRMQVLMQSMPAYFRTPTPPDFTGTSAMMLMGTVIMAVPIWFLIRRRDAFGKSRPTT
ncbi:MAG TPA: hypothetical protein VKU19_20730 [Bryobacteraceae bacterium]|nr:hypothetical protein [Bryobacteraceae bacterium]